MSMSEGKSSLAKGKAIDNRRWRANWWDFQPLVEDLQRPTAWSSSSTIFVAHQTQPIILGRLFPSSKQFLVVSPDPILRSPTSYKPPSIITVSPNDRWLFAFYPSHDGDGIACLWNRGCCVDTWLVKECWPFSRGADVITAAWAGTEREWSTSSDGSSSRLPPRGPLTPVSNPTLLLVTQSHQLHVCYLRTYVSSLRMLSCSLIQPYLTAEGQPLGALHDTPAGPKTSRLCTNASIGFIYGESSVLVAMRSRRHPTSDSLKPAAYNDLDLGLSLDLSQPHNTLLEEPSPPLEFGALAEEETIELCEVKLRFDGTLISLVSHPLPPLHHPYPHVIDLTFVCSPPPRPDPWTSPKTSPKKDKQPVRPVTEPPSTFLVASFLDFEDYTATPKSVAVTYAVARIPPSTPMKIAWSFNQVGERSFSPRVLTFTCSGLVSPYPRKGIMIAFLADVSGPVSRGSQKVQEVIVGNIAVLKLPGLTDDPEWESTPIMTPTSRAGMDWPVNITMSRNRVLLCATMLGRMSIHALPKQLNKPPSSDPTLRNLSLASVAVVTSLLSRRSIADITHVLSAPTVPLDTIVETLRGTWVAFEANARAGVTGGFSAADIFGATVELYRARALHATDGDEKQFFDSLWRNAHNMCSMMACFVAFEDCKDPEGYDLEAVWQLVSLSEWAIRFLEKLIKECLSVVDLVEPASPPNAVQSKVQPVDDLRPLNLEAKYDSFSSPLDLPILLHLAHPSTITNLIGVVIHVNRFYHSLGSLTPKGENAQIARDILMDVIDCSGLDLKGLEEVFKSVIQDVRSIPGDEGKLALARCHPVPAQYGFLRKMLQTLDTSPAINKPRLFIKPANFVDGFASLSASEQPPKEQERDVVTKGVLLRRGPGLLCLRCGYRSEVGGEVAVAGHVSFRWKTWEKVWATRCVCGGAWVCGKG